jgi:hypothetical protein
MPRPLPPGFIAPCLATRNAVPVAALQKIATTPLG